jgi:hypothetical protein
MESGPSLARLTPAIKYMSHGSHCGHTSRHLFTAHHLLNHMLTSCDPHPPPPQAHVVRPLASPTTSGSSTTCRPLAYFPTTGLLNHLSASCVPYHLLNQMLTSCVTASPNHMLASCVTASPNHIIVGLLRHCIAQPHVGLLRQSITQPHVTWALASLHYRSTTCWPLASLHRSTTCHAAPHRAQPHVIRLTHEHQTHVRPAANHMLDGSPTRDVSRANEGPAGNSQRYCNMYIRVRPTPTRRLHFLLLL